MADRWRTLTGVPILAGYGLTEAAPAICVNPVDIEDFTGSIGLPLPSTEVQVRDEEGRKYRRGARRIVCPRPQVMRGYWRRPEETARILRDGWLLTGDIATMDKQGFFYMVDHKKRPDSVSGFDVFPVKSSRWWWLVRGVLEAACIGVPDEKSGSAIKVFVVPKPGWN